MKKLIPILFIILFVIVFFWQFFVKGLLPVPADTIIGLYHPFRDLYAKDYPNGIPFKNFLITDPVRQQFPWRELSISIEKKLEFPLWNPYNFSGTPLLANFQSAPFYFFNILFFIMPFTIAWSLIVFLGPLLGGIFLFLYLENLRLSKWASVLGGVTFALSGFSVAWMEWGTITHVGLWLPLILLAIDKIFLSLQSFNSKFKIQNSKLQFKSKNLIIWNLIFIFSLTSSFFAGHLQTFFYLFIFSSVYFFARWIQSGWQKKILFLFIILNSLFIILTAVQWIPTLQFILLSARNIDSVSFNNPGWFIPWQNLIQFVAPDFFGNPTTLNYWGVWNYAEFVGYVGAIPFIMAIVSLFFRRDKKTLFFGTMLFLSLVFALPTFFAYLPYILKIPFINTAQPTRLLFIGTFSLVVLAGLGFDYISNNRKKINIFYPLTFIFSVFVFLWFSVINDPIIKLVPFQNMPVVKSNLLLPTVLFGFSAVIFLILSFVKKSKFTIIIYIIIVGITVFDLYRFGLKFIPFTNSNYLFPQTKAIAFLQQQKGQFRIMSTDSRIFPPNFSAIYRLQSVDGYDPLYLRRYGELIAASERGNPDIAVPFGFNRIITPKNYESKIIDLLGVKYILSLKDLSSSKLEKVFQEGETRIYNNINVMPRVFFVEAIKAVNNKEEAIRTMFAEDFDFRKTAVVENYRGVNINTHPMCTECNAKITSYSENRVVVETNTNNDGFLVLTDTSYPTWHAKIDSVETNIYITDYNFRGINVSKGKHKIEFYITLP